MRKVIYHNALWSNKKCCPISASTGPFEFGLQTTTKNEARGIVLVLSTGKLNGEWFMGKLGLDPADTVKMQGASCGESELSAWLQGGGFDEYLKSLHDTLSEVSLISLWRGYHVWIAKLPQGVSVIKVPEESLEFIKRTVTSTDEALLLSVAVTVTVTRVE